MKHSSEPGGVAPYDCEVFVLGGGPAGTTTATLLAERGRDVLIAEKDRHPRFHIGESLLPLNMLLFDKLGIRDKIERIGLHKYGAEFNSPQHSSTVTLQFGDAWDTSFPYSYHVRRSEFDQLLWEHCVEKGARGVQGTRVIDVDPRHDCVLVTTRDETGAQQQWRAQFLVDASGRDTFLANKFGIKHKNRKHNSAALYGHFTGAKRLPGREEGNISLFWFEHGWFWFIPLRDGTTSVGAVCWPYYLKSRKTDPTTFFHQTIAMAPALAERLKDAELINEVTATGNYSYQADHMVGSRYIMVGDAFAFVDPVFSAGVYLAMNSAFIGAEAVDTWLRNPQAGERLLRAFDRNIRHGIRNFSWFIYRMTSPAMRELFMHPRNPLRMQEALMSLLAGDLFRGTPIYWSLRAFKGVYYITSLRNWRRCVIAWRRRKQAIKEVGSDPQHAGARS
jgi:flavin-dependent dehydrogenase